MHERLSTLRDGPDVTRLVTDLFGTAAASTLAGSLAADVAQTVAVTPVDGIDHVLAINAHAPRSDLDYFVLSFMRARVDAVVVSAEVLRREPHLRYGLQGRAGWSDVATALQDWRRRRVEAGDATQRGMAGPRLVVLTRSGDVPLDHGVWSSVPRAEIHTGPGGAETLRDAARQRGIQVCDDPEPGVFRSLDRLLATGARGVAVEAGPRASAPLYDAETRLGTVLRSVYEPKQGDSVDDRAVGPRWLGPGALEIGFERRGPTSPVRFAEPGWRFEWWTRRARSR